MAKVGGQAGYGKGHFVELKVLHLKYRCQKQRMLEWVGMLNSY